jgi:hypothetical protein
VASLPFAGAEGIEGAGFSLLPHCVENGLEEVSGSELCWGKTYDTCDEATLPERLLDLLLDCFLCFFFFSSSSSWASRLSWSMIVEVVCVFCFVWKEVCGCGREGAG